MIWLEVVNGTVILSAVIAGALAWYGWRQGTVSGHRYFSWLMLAIAEYSLAVALELSSSSIPAKIFWSKVEFAGAASLAPLWLLVALSFGQYNRWLTRRWVALIWVVPVVAFLLAATNEWHGLIWSDVRPLEGSAGHLAVL